MDIETPSDNGAVPRQPEDLVPGDRVGPFELVGVLGTGGAGKVFRALQPSLRREVALKILRPGMAGDRDHRRRFVREAQLAARVQEPALVRIIDAGEDKGQLYIAYELVRGTTVKKAIEDAGRLTPAEAVRVVLGCGRALAALHAQQILHRDVKPANLFLSADRGVLLGDLGCARDLNSQGVRTTAGFVLGTPAYLAPEMALGEPAVPGSDLYGLGVTFYECLTGRLPFQATNAAQMLYMHVAVEPPDVCRQLPGLPPEYGDFVRKALAKKTQERFRDAREMLRAAQSLLGAESGVEFGSEVRRIPAVASASSSRAPAPGPISGESPGGRPGADRGRARLLRASLAAAALLALLLGWFWPASGPGGPGAGRDADRPPAVTGPSATEARTEPALAPEDPGRLRREAEDSLTRVVRMGVSLRTAQERGMSEPELTKARLGITSAWRRALERLGAVLGLSQPASSPSLPDDDDQLLLQALEVERELDLTIRGAMLQESDQRLARGKWGFYAWLLPYQQGDAYDAEIAEASLAFLTRMPAGSWNRAGPYLQAGLVCLEGRTGKAFKDPSERQRQRDRVLARGLEVLGRLARGDGDFPRRFRAFEAVLRTLGEGKRQTELLPALTRLQLEVGAGAAAPSDGMSPERFAVWAALETERLKFRHPPPLKSSGLRGDEKAVQEWQGLRDLLARRLTAAGSRPASTESAAATPEEALRRLLLLCEQKRTLLTGETPAVDEAR